MWVSVDLKELRRKGVGEQDASVCNGCRCCMRCCLSALTALGLQRWLHVGCCVLRMRMSGCCLAEATGGLRCLLAAVLLHVWRSRQGIVRVLQPHLLVEHSFSCSYGTLLQERLLRMTPAQREKYKERKDKIQQKRMMKARTIKG